ncbi:DUF445 domain-containing protein [Altererythrobacter sp. SALINAS58]|uniref:DUF445 domain-containing protein n=1 Tax=Alteripontixanthobacter muriae TaxID=2705546 RepID=UPI0015771C47|nr:DUF445 domain-containing protein [Alteripontixanthobacter muriae]NTZ43467.1 DUF445 domain-containing protein [Alteripontixanthobacter muriae]
MRIAATLMLVLMAGLFLLAREFEHQHTAWGYLHAFAEAALVGGLADWFAVTALFRRPMGLPIPHTAIIPENKDRIADTMADFLRANFLTPAVIARRMQSMNLAAGAGAFLTGPAQGPKGDSEGLRGRIGAGAGELFAEVLESLDQERLGGQVQAGLKAQLARIEIAPLMGQMLSAVIADKRHLPLIDAFIRWAGVTLEENEPLVREMIQSRANAFLRFAGLDERLANSVLDGMYRMLAEVLVDPDHPLRRKVEDGLEKLAHDLVNDPAMRARVEGVKEELLANPALGNWWTGVWERMRTSLIAMARGGGTAGEGKSQMAGYFAELSAELGKALQEDRRLQIQINRFARRTAVGVATRYGGQIVRLVSETVRRWDAQTVTSRIEGAVGRDLQFIRINGTLVGGLVGLTIHSLDAVFS